MALHVEGLDATDLEDYGPGEIIYTQGEDADCLYLVVEGEVTLKVGGGLVDTVKEGGFLGEMAILERAPRFEHIARCGRVRVSRLR